MDQHLHGSPEIWDELFSNQDLSYSEKADTQGKLFELVKVKFLEKLFRVYDYTSDVQSGIKSLEVGCGTAFVSLYFAKRSLDVTCLDTSKQILEVAEDNFKKEKVMGKFVIGDAGKLPFKDDSFDIVMSFGLLEHFSDPGPAICEMVRVLKPNGLFFADIVPARFSVQSLGNIFNAVAVLGYWGMKACFARDLHRRRREARRESWGKGWEKAKANFYPQYYENSLSWQEYQRIIEKAGLKGVEVRGNRPFPRLTLSKNLDYFYTFSLKFLTPFWKLFDSHGGLISKWWGAGWWMWGRG